MKLNRARVTVIAALAGSAVGAIVFAITGWGAGFGALLGAAGGLSAAVGWYWGSNE